MPPAFFEPLRSNGILPDRLIMAKHSGDFCGVEWTQVSLFDDGQMLTKAISFHVLQVLQVLDDPLS